MAKSSGDLIKDKVVIISPVYTTCKGSCPMMTANLARIQKWLGEQLEGNARLLSITVDPETDSPTVLKEPGLDGIFSLEKRKCGTCSAPVGIVRGAERGPPEFVPDR
jgi:hypothetical protein